MPAISFVVTSETEFFNLTTNWAKDNQIFRVNVHSFLADMSSPGCLIAVILTNTIHCHTCNFFPVQLQTNKCFLYFLEQTFVSRAVLQVVWNLQERRKFSTYTNNLFMVKEGTFIINVRSKHHQVRNACDITFIHLDCTKIIFTCNLSCVILGADYLIT